MALPALRIAPAPPVGSWRKLGRIATGSGTVLDRVTDAAGRRVALKSAASADVRPSVRARLALEAAALRRATTMGVVRLVEDGSAHAEPYLALELLDGPTLRALVERRGPLRATQAQTVGALVADILARVHGRGVIHGDVKPANVVCLDGGPVLIDFDAALQLDDDSTRELHWRCSPSWLAPEQALGEAFGPATDVFALGSLLAYLATGRPPFGTGNAAAVLYRVVHEPPDLTGVPSSLRSVVDRCLQKEPGSRPSASWAAEHLLGGRAVALAAA